MSLGSKQCLLMVSKLGNSHALPGSLMMCHAVQDELDDILRYGAAELFADAVAASKTKTEEAVSAGQSLHFLSVGMSLQCLLVPSFTCHVTV